MIASHCAASSIDILRGWRWKHTRGKSGGWISPTGLRAKYLMLIYDNQEKWASIPAEEWSEAIAKQDAFNKKYQATGELIGAYGLADEVRAKLVRRENGLPAVTDGPYQETKEYIASFYLLDCESEERALQIAADMPWADQEPVEFWPIMHEAKLEL